MSLQGCYHFRVSVSSRLSAFLVADKLFEFVKPFIEVIKTGYDDNDQFTADIIYNDYGIAYECVDENHHIHCHFEFNGKIQIDAFNKRRQKFIAQLKAEQLVPNVKEAQYMEKLKKDKFSNLVYCLKGKDYLKHNLSDEELKKIENENERIDLEKDIPMKTQLHTAWVAKYKRFFLSKYEAYTFIDSYHVERDYLPPTLSLKNQYSIYILVKMGQNFEHTPSTMVMYQSVMYDLLGIRHDYEVLHDTALSKILNKIDLKNSDFVDSETEQEENETLVTFS